MTVLTHPSWHLSWERPVWRRVLHARLPKASSFGTLPRQSPLARPPTGVARPHRCKGRRPCTYSWAFVCGKVSRCFSRCLCQRSLSSLSRCQHLTLANLQDASGEERECILEPDVASTCRRRAARVTPVHGSALHKSVCYGALVLGYIGEQSIKWRSEKKEQAKEAQAIPFLKRFVMALKLLEHWAVAAPLGGTSH